MSKIILHSDQSYENTGAVDSKLLCSLTGKRLPKLGYIPSRPDPRRKYFSEKSKYYEKLGFPGLTYFDPEEEHTEEEIEKFFRSDVIHLSGGEACPFMDRLRETGCDKLLLQFAARGGVLLGVSAGAMILGRTFTTATLFRESGCTDGLGLFDFEVVPHVSEHFPRIDALRTFAIKHKKIVYALNDGDVVVVTTSKIQTFGSPKKLEFNVS